MTALFNARGLPGASASEISAGQRPPRREPMADSKTAIVTGAGTGIGKAVATALAEAGWNTVFTGRRRELLDAAVDSAGGNGGRGAGHRLRRHQGRRRSIACSRRLPSASAAASICFSTMPACRLKSTLIDEIPVEVWNDGRRRQSDGFVPVRPRGVPDDAPAAADGRAHHQQRLGLGLCAAPRLACPTRPPSMPSPGSPRRWRSTAGRSTSPAARSTSAMR